MAKEEKDKKDKKYKSPFMRAFQAGAGMGMIRGNFVPVASALVGKSNVWHGTPINNLLPGEHGRGILREGLSTDFAGKNKRLNNVLMSNSLIRETEEFLKKKKVKITPEVEKMLFESTDQMVEKLKGGKGESIVAEIMKSTKRLAGKLNLDPKEFGEFYKKTLPDMGQRLYFGKSPESVAFWAEEGKNEADYLIKKMMGEADMVQSGVKGQLKANAKIIGESIAEQGTGGFYGDIKAKLQYGRPKEILSVDGLKGLEKELVKHKGEAVNVVFRSSIPARTMHHMKDFPVLRHAIASSPGLKMLLGKYIPQNDPSKDLSISENVSPKNINRAEIVDKKTGKVMKRINVKGSTKQSLKILGGKDHILKNVKKSVIPGAMVATGGGLLYNAITGRSAWEDIGHLFKEEEKTAAISAKTMAKVVGYPAGFTAAVLGGNYGIRKLRGLELPEIITEEEAEDMSFSDKVKHQAKEFEFYRKTVPLTSLLAGALGAGIGAGIGKSNRVVGSLVGSYLGSTLGTAAESVPKEVQQLRTDPEHSGLLTGLLAKTEKGKELLEEYPEAFASGHTALMTGATTGLPYYTAKKYYPYHTEKGVRAVKKMLAKAKMFGEAMKDSPMQKAMNKKLIKALPVTVGAVPALTYLTYLGTEKALKATAAGIDAATDKEDDDKAEKGLSKVKE